jgi:signal transduction histidine kinase
MAPAPLKILLVEDSSSDALLLQESLAEEGPGRFHFTHVACWAEAADHLRQQPLDVLLLDLSLPDSTGRETVLRARAAAPHLPIVVLTGIEDETVGLEAVRHGVQDYLVKGQTDGRLIARSIRYAVERKQTEEALARSRDDLERLVQERTATLQETVAELEHFSYALIHDLRAPLRALQGFSELLLEEGGDCQSPQNKDYLRHIITASHRMDQLVIDALSYSKTVREVLPLGPVDPLPLLRGLIDTYPNLQPFKGHIRLESPFPLVLANEAGLTQCFSNLLGNAVKFTRPGTKPEVRVWAESAHGSLPPPQGQGRDKKARMLRGAEDATRKPQREPTVSPAHTPHSFLLVRLWVEDQGIGIPQTFQSRIFDMFQRGGSAQEGTGIGLAIVRKVVERMGGEVGVHSEEGKGSRFWVELRAAAPT